MLDVIVNSIFDSISIIGLDVHSMVDSIVSSIANLIVNSVIKFDREYDG